MILSFIFKNQPKTNQKPTKQKKPQTPKTPAICIKIMREILFKNALNRNLCLTGFANGQVSTEVVKL